MSFKISSIGHWFAIAVHDVKVALTFLVAHESQVDATVNTGVAIVDPTLAPLASTIERAGEALLGDALALVSKLDEADAAKGVNLVLDAQTVADLKALLADIQKVQPSAANIPANLPTVAAA